MGEAQTKALILFIGAGMKVLSIRIILILSLCMTFALFVWAMYMPDRERIAAATIFTVLVFLPAIRADFKVAQSDNSKGAAE
jgi:uncharacterized membrane protein YqjE